MSATTPLQIKLFMRQVSPAPCTAINISWNKEIADTLQSEDGYVLEISGVCKRAVIKSLDPMLTIPKPCRLTNLTTRLLWKLMVEGEGGDEYRQILDAELASGHVRIQRWLTADPVSIFQSVQVVCSVHHGGANSFYEACRYDSLSQCS
jgi:hypothetical protein